MQKRSLLRADDKRKAHEEGNPVFQKLLFKIKIYK
jgi:hypothetical protein